MITVEEKLNIFKQELVQKIASDRNEKIDKARKLAKKELLESGLSLEKQREQIIERFDRTNKRNVSKILAEGNLNSKELYLETRKSLRQDFYETVLKEARKMVDSDLYKSYLKNCVSILENILEDQDEALVYIRPQDKKEFLKTFRAFNKHTHLKFKDLPEKSIGGFIIRDQSERSSYDFTILDLIDENERKISLTFNKLLENGNLNAGK